MAGFGGAVKLTGESEYRKALNQITQNLKEVTAQMNVVSSSYDKNDKSVQALTAKQNVLNLKLTEQTSKLNNLKAQYQSMSNQYTQQQTKHDALVKSYNDEKAKLDLIGKALGTTSKEYQAQQQKVTQLSQDVRKSASAQDYNKQSMDKMRISMLNAQADINKTAKELDNLGNEAQDAGKQAEQASSGGFTVMKGILADLGATAIKSALNGLKQLGGAFLNVGKQAYALYAQNEQLVGGVETLFGESADKLIEYANEAYKTAGISANEYMEQATSFSATLLQGLEGDTGKAVEYTDMAIKDMSDNANKMGTSMQMIQNAYQGFAKDNYTMLDNLKLGYGGTQSEMARLINDSGVLGSSVKVTAKTVKDVPFDKVIEAIHKIQQNIGITGTTTAEAMGTIEGSTKQMSASWQNLLIGMASDTADFNTLIDNFVNSVVAVANNSLPRVQKIITGMGKMVSELLKTLVPELVKSIPPLLTETLPILIEAVNSMVTAVLDIMPTIMPVISELIPQIVSALVTMLPQLLNAGIQIIMSLVQGMAQTIPQLVALLPQILTEIVNIITTSLPQMVQTGIDIWTALIDGIMTAVPQLIAMLPEIITSLVNTIVTELPRVLDLGVDVLNALIDGILQTIPMLVKMLPEIIDTTVTTLVKLLPEIIETGEEVLDALVNGISEAIPLLIDMLPTIIDTIIDVLMKNLPLIIEAGMDILVAVIKGLTQALPQLISMVPQIITTIVSTLARNLPQILSMGVQILGKLVSGIGSAIGSLISMAGKIVTTILTEIGKLPSRTLEIGTNLVKGLWNGIKDATGWILDKIKGFGKSVLNGMKKIFGIKSPSKLMEDEVGVYLAQGIGVGFEDEMKSVSKQMQNSIPHSFNVDSSISGSSTSRASQYSNMVDAFKEALSQMKIELDDDEVGRFIDKTVTRLVYN